MVWARFFASFGNTAGLSQDILNPFIIELGLANMLPGTTITRVVGTHDLRVVSVDDLFTRWVWGLVVAPRDDAPAIGVDPSDQPGRDWMFVRQEAVVQVQDAGTPVVKRRAAHYDIDLKSQRKLGEVGRTLYYVGDNIDGDNFDVAVNFNVLLKLP